MMNGHLVENKLEIHLLLNTPSDHFHLVFSVVSNKPIYFIA